MTFWNNGSIRSILCESNVTWPLLSKVHLKVLWPSLPFDLALLPQRNVCWIGLERREHGLGNFQIPFFLHSFSLQNQAEERDWSQKEYACWGKSRFCGDEKNLAIVSFDKFIEDRSPLSYQENRDSTLSFEHSMDSRWSCWGTPGWWRNNKHYDECNSSSESFIFG